MGVVVPKCGRGHLSGGSRLCGEQHRVLVFGLKC